MERPKLLIYADASRNETCSFTGWRKARQTNNVEHLARMHNYYKGLQRLNDEARPSAFHQFVKELVDDGYYDVSILTTDIDDLYERVGVPPSKIVHLHGMVTKRRCTNCQCTFEDLTTTMWTQNTLAERCPQTQCGSRYVKTDVRFHEEACPAYMRAVQNFNKMKFGDVVVIIGASHMYHDNTLSIQHLWANCRRRHVHTVCVQLTTHTSADINTKFSAHMTMQGLMKDIVPEIQLYMRSCKMVSRLISD